MKRFLLKPVFKVNATSHEEAWQKLWLMLGMKDVSNSNNYEDYSELVDVMQSVTQSHKEIRYKRYEHEKG